MGKNRLHIVTIIVGSFLALAIAFSHFLTPQFFSSSHDDQVQTEQQAGDRSSEEGASFVSLPSFSLPAPVNVESSLNPYCLFEIFFEDESDEVDDEEVVSYTDRFFELMFQVIISPNAP